MNEQKQKYNRGIKTSQILEEINWYEDTDEIGVVV